MSMPPPPPPGQGFPPPGDGSDGSRPPGGPPPGSQPPGFGQPPPPGYGTLPPAAPPPGPPPGPHGGASAGGNDTPKILGIISIVLGVIGIPAACCCWPIGIVVAIGTLVCAGIGWSQLQGQQPQGSDKQLVIAGLVLGGVVALLTILSFALGMFNVFSGYRGF